MYIVLSSQIVNHFEVHYRDIDKLCGCLNVFLIIISYPAEVFQLESSVGIFQTKWIIELGLKLIIVYGLVKPNHSAE